MPIHVRGRTAPGGLEHEIGRVGGLELALSEGGSVLQVSHVASADDTNRADIDLSKDRQTGSKS